ncbi:MAG: hypothetical protein Q8Q89_01920 [bacterium]|nr:hypothetical protein [bacterium]
MVSKIIRRGVSRRGSQSPVEYFPTVQEGDAGGSCGRSCVPGTPGVYRSSIQHGDRGATGAHPTLEAKTIIGTLGQKG